MNRSLSRVVLVACMLISSAAWGQPSPVAQPTTAETVDEHLRRGVELRRAGHDDEAVAEFVEAYRLAPGPRTAAQLGLARQAVGDWLEADRLLRESLASPDDLWVSRNRASLESMLSVTATHVGTLEVRANVPGAEVHFEDTTVITLPMREPLRVLAGTISMEVSAPGHVTASRRFVVRPGATVRESVELRPEAPPPPPVTVAVVPVVAPLPRALRPAPMVEAPARPWWRRWAWAPTLAGGAALALAGTALAVREDAAVRYNSAHCPPSPPTAGACGNFANTAATWEVVGWTAGITGVVLVAVGVTMFALPSSSGRRRALACAPAGAGFVCRLTF